MKKILGLVCLGLATLGLASCDDDVQKLQFTDDAGNQQEVTVEKTDDKEVVQGVFQYMGSANYSTISNFSTSLDMNVSMTTASKVSTDLNLDAKLSLALEQGFAGSLKLTTKDQEMMRYEMLYNGSLSGSKLEGDIYLTSKVAQKEDKIKYPAGEILDDILDKVEDEIEDKIPEIPDLDFEAPSFTLEDFYKDFTSSKLEISEVSSSSIQIRLRLVLDDLLKKALSNEEYSQIKQLLKIDLKEEFVFLCNMDPKTGYVQQITFTIDNVELINALLMLVKSEQVPTLELLTAFKLEMKWKFSYKDVVIQKLTDAEKALYRQIELS